MKKLIVALLLIGIVSSPITIVVVSALGMTKSESLDYLINQGYHKIASKLMSKEIIRQLKEKEGKTIRDYYIEEYFRKFKKER